jgi:hypothetical protein
MTTLWLPNRAANSKLELMSISEFSGYVKEIRDFFALHCVPLPNCPLTTALDMADQLASSWKKGDDLQAAMNRREGHDLLIIWRLSRIFKELRNTKDKLLKEKLTLLTSGPISPALHNPSHARETLYELETFSRLHNIYAGFCLREGAGADIGGSYHGDLIQVECKYNNSKTNIVGQTTKAIEQIQFVRQIPGIISFQIEAHTPHSHFETFDNSLDAYKYLEKWVRDFFDEFNPLIQNLLDSTSNVIGLFYTAHSAAFIKKKNFVDVGTCAVTNSRRYSHKGSFNFSLLTALGKDLGIKIL